MALAFINLAYGGHNDARDATLPYQNFVIEGHPEYGSGTPELKAGDHFRGVVYGSARNFNFSVDPELRDGQVGEGTRVGAVAIPAHSIAFNMEWRVDHPLTDNEGNVVAATVTAKLVGAGTVLGTFPLDEVGSGAFTIGAGLDASNYSAKDDVIELLFEGMPTVETSTDSFMCVDLNCDSNYTLCMTVACNYINNSIEHKCRPFC